MKLQWIEFKNLMKSGNQLNRFEFDDAGSTILITGENGAGKSQILDAIMLAWYGTTHRGGVTQKDLVNRTNKKNLYIRSQAVCGGKTCVVEFGEEPKIRKLTIDNEPITIPKRVRWDKWIVSNTHRLPKEVFLQTSIIGKSNYKPFLSLGLAERRELIENIFGLEIFSVMLEVVKERIKQNDKQRQLLTSKIELLAKDISHAREKLETARRINGERIEYLSQAKGTLLGQRRTHEAILAESEIPNEEQNRINTAVRDADNEAGHWNNYLIQCGAMITSAESALTELFQAMDGKTCPTCGQDMEVNHDHINQKLEGVQADLKKMYADRIKFTSNLELARTKLEAARGEQNRMSDRLVTVSEANAHIMGIDRELNGIERELTELNKPVRIDVTDEDVLRMDQESRDADKQRQDLVEVWNYLTHIRKNVLVDSGIKSHAIKQFLPELQETINKLLRRYDLEYAVRFKPDFSVEVVDVVGGAINAETFSEGQKQRVNLSLWAALTDMIKMMRNVHCNILIFDEVLDGSLDAAGREEFINSLQSRVDQNNSAAFIISHFHHASDNFASEIRVSIVDGFTKYMFS